MARIVGSAIKGLVSNARLPLSHQQGSSLPNATMPPIQLSNRPPEVVVRLSFDFARDTV
jgi:hypothetical protein